MATLLCLLSILTVLHTVVRAENVICPKSSNCQCNEASPCVMNCMDTDHCKGSNVKLQCRSGQPCTIHCSGSSSCIAMTVEGSGATSLTMKCSNKDSCKDATVNCPEGGACDFECTTSAGSDKSCEAMTVFADDVKSFLCIGPNCDLSNLPPSFTASPSTDPTSQPTADPTSFPSSEPTRNPTSFPSSDPTRNPSAYPSHDPTFYPTLSPTSNEDVLPFVECPYGSHASRPVAGCSGFRIRLIDDWGLRCYLSLGECSDCQQAHVYESDDEMNLFWDCGSLGAKWKLIDELTNATMIQSLVTGYIVQAETAAGRSATNLKADRVVNETERVWSSWTFEEDDVILMQTDDHCFMTHSARNHTFVPAEGYSHGNEVTTGYEATVSCNGNARGVHIEFVYGGIPNPVPGEVVIVDMAEGNGTLRLNENTTYMHPGHTLQCNMTFGDVAIDSDNDTNSTASTRTLMDSSYIVISHEMYESAERLQEGGILLATLNAIESDIAAECIARPALKIVSIEVLSEGVKLFVVEATLFEYIVEMDVDLTGLPFYADSRVPEPSPFDIDADELVEELESQNISNATLTFYEYECVDLEYDDVGFAYRNTSYAAVNGTCGNTSIADEQGSGYGYNGFLPANITNSTDGNRRRMGWGSIGRVFKRVARAVFKVVKKVVKEVVKTVVEIVKDIIQILKGDVTKTLFDYSFDVGSKHFSITFEGNQFLDEDLAESELEGEYIAISHFKLEGGAYFYAGAYANFRCKYGFSGVSLFRFVVGMATEFDAWFEFEITGVVGVEKELYKKSKNGFLMIAGIIPVVYELYGSVGVGIEVEFSIGISAKAGYPRVAIEFGVEYSGGWRTINNFPTSFNLYQSFGARMLDSDDCIEFMVVPYAFARFGVILYGTFDIWVRPQGSFPTTLVWPATCNALDACHQPVSQLGFSTDFELILMYGVTATISIKGIQIGPAWATSRTLDLFGVTLFDQLCVPVLLPFLEKKCCPPTPSPTASPTPAPIPTATPTAAPTLPSTNPTPSPSASPTTPSVAPSVSPTAVPTAQTLPPSTAPTRPDIVVPCVTRRGAEGSYGGSHRETYCEAGETLVGCGVDGVVTVISAYVSPAWPDRCQVKADVSLEAEAAYPMARCCTFPSGLIESAGGANGPSVTVSQVSTACPSGMLLSSCGGRTVVDYFAGIWPTSLSARGQAFNWTSTQNRCNFAVSQTTNNAYFKPRVSAHCFTFAADSGYAWDCITRQTYTVSDGFGSCPDTHPIMTSCHAYTGEGLWDSPNAFYVTSNNTCFAQRENGQPLWVSAICCGLHPTLSGGSSAAKQVPQALQLQSLQQVQPNSNDQDEDEDQNDSHSRFGVGFTEQGVRIYNKSGDEYIALSYYTLLAFAVVIVVWMTVMCFVTKRNLHSYSEVPVKVQCYSEDDAIKKLDL